MRIDRRLIHRSAWRVVNSRNFISSILRKVSPRRLLGKVFQSRHLSLGTKCWSSEGIFAVARITGGDTGIGPFANARVGGSQEVSGRSSYPHTLSKNPRRFRGYKHTSLTFLGGESSEFRFSLAQETILVTL